MSPTVQTTKCHWNLLFLALLPVFVLAAMIGVQFNGPIDNLIVLAWLVPAWQIPDPQAVQLRLDVNDKPMQEDSTANMIWTVREQIAYLSTIVTLEPGDVIATGTPTGVGMGRGVFLNDGDRMVASVEGIGRLANQVRQERAA